jgi:hypothetical protein
MKRSSSTVTVSHASAARSMKLPDEYIVVFDDSVRDVHGRARALAEISNANVRYEYTGALRGYAAHMSARAADAIALHPGVAYLGQDAEN